MARHPGHRPGAKNPKLTEAEARAVLFALDIVAKASDRYQAMFEPAEWRALQRGSFKISQALKR